MIITQTPYRVSFAGGGTDLPAFYRQEQGAVLSVALDRHMYVTVHRRFEPTIRVAYSQTETVEAVDQLEHTIIRESLKWAGIKDHLEITTIGDVPAGTGMGSSSTLTVGVLNALHAYLGQSVDREKLASDACRIEMDMLGKPIGKQDQYAAAYGGFNHIQFNPDESVVVSPIDCPPEVISELERWALMLYTGDQRDADRILSKQSAGTDQNRSILREMKNLADRMVLGLKENQGMESFAQLLHEGWLLKRSMGFGISHEKIDRWYDAATESGAIGGKLLGAGGGGFMLFLAPPDRHGAIRDALGRPRELPFRIDRLGSHTIFSNHGDGP